ncbi:glutamate synthase [NADPH] large chain [Vibrio maritimus]|uniref:Glutamate synthase [NADPH] large chain n=1 Tax=Vibrio maritimus TaxID=990268 RepID=A0A090TCK0_9VIBR|nr:glutamate synthase [NADPH] large chain [Vibrio maritimus]
MKSGDASDYKSYAKQVNDRPVAMLRDLMKLKKADNALPLEQIEPNTELFKRFDSAAMSIGALSQKRTKRLPWR